MRFGKVFKTLTTHSLNLCIELRNIGLIFFSSFQYRGNFFFLVCDQLISLLEFSSRCTLLYLSIGNLRFLFINKKLLDRRSPVINEHSRSLQTTAYSLKSDSFYNFLSLFIKKLQFSSIFLLQVSNIITRLSLVVIDIDRIEKLFGLSRVFSCLNIIFVT